VCKDCTVLGIKIDLVYPNTQRADAASGVYLHHAIAFNEAVKRKMKATVLDGWIEGCIGAGGGIQGTLMPWVLSGIRSLTNNLESGILGFGAVDEFTQKYTTADGKFNSGYYIGPNDKIMIQAEIVNYKTTPQEVYLQFDTEYLTGKPAGLKEAITAISSATSKSICPFRTSQTKISLQNAVNLNSFSVKEKAN